MSTGKTVLSVQENNKIRLAVIIPTLNGARWLKEIFPALKNQTRVPDEILVIDSGSSDETLGLARRYGAITKSIDPAAFDHGGTRKAAAGLVSAEILVYMTQDAVPVDEKALENLIAPFAESKVAATYGRQVPNPDATSFAKHLRLFNYPEQSSLRCLADRNKYGFKTAFISNSFAAYRRSMLESVGFFEERMLFGEDTFTVAKLLHNGYCVAYAADAQVLHSHNYTIVQEFRRYFDIGVVHAGHLKVLESFGSAMGEGKRYLVSELKFLAGNREYLLFPVSIIRNGMKFLAYNIGRRYKILPRSLAALCSMNRWWWNTK